jgi:hypothetical protein
MIPGMSQNLDTFISKWAAVFAGVDDDELLGYGVPAEWLNDVKKATEDTILAVDDRLPAEAAEALLELATGGKPRVSQPVPAAADPFDHPDAQRRFRVMTNVEELQRALDFPWEEWTVFLHPEQREWVEREHTGPARVSGSAGTGKTIVALHRAADLARKHPDARGLLTTFTGRSAREDVGRSRRGLHPRRSRGPCRPLPHAPCVQSRRPRERQRAGPGLRRPGWR